MGKEELFKDFYNIIAKAPGESDWVNLLKNETVLILLDELPPYLDRCQAEKVVNSDLSRVTAAALANLFSAIGRKELSRVCLVFSDLQASYEHGSEILSSSFKDLENEANRSAIDIAPVKLNTDEVYSILKKRLFEDEKLAQNYTYEVEEIAKEYKNAVSNSRKLGFSSYSGEKIYTGIIDSYPFHPSIKELYARFKDNQNFQATRGIIKLMRQIVRDIWERDEAEHKFLLNVSDINLNNPNIYSYIQQIKPSLENAISKDIAGNGKSTAEIIDEERGDGKEYAQIMGRLLIVSCLADVPNATLGLTDAEALGYASEPNLDISLLKTALEELKNECWYIKSDNKGRIYFQQNKNITAEVNSLINSYTDDNARKELREKLEEIFTPEEKICYEKIFVMPAIDEINLDLKKISLVIFEPCKGNEINPDIQTFYDNASYKNRVMFLSGTIDRLEKLYSESKKLKAIKAVFENLKSEGTSAKDSQYKDAEDKLDRAQNGLLSTIRETFVNLYYPTKKGLTSTYFKLEFTNNNYRGERQIIDILKERQKYSEWSKSSDFLEDMREKCEARIFTAKEKTWQHIYESAANTPGWGWYDPGQLDYLINDSIKKGKWKEQGGYIIKGPFEKEPTSVYVRQDSYNQDNNKFILKIQESGGTVYYDEGEPDKRSPYVRDNRLETDKIALNFICIDDTGERKTGEIYRWRGKPSIRYKDRVTENGRIITLETHPECEIRYTTDGSEPKENGERYAGEFPAAKDCKFILAAALYKGEEVSSETIKLSDVNEDSYKIEQNKAVRYKMKKSCKQDDTASVYKELAELGKGEGIKIKSITIEINDKNDMDSYIEYTSNVKCVPEAILEIIDTIRERNFKDREVKITFSYSEIFFNSGAAFSKWISETKKDLKKIFSEGEVIHQ